MEAQNIIAFEYKKEERIYRLQMPSGAPLGEAYEAACSFLSEMGRMVNEHVQSQLPKDPSKENDAEKAEDSSLPVEDAILEEA